jgi:hypothetical protein
MDTAQDLIGLVRAICLDEDFSAVRPLADYWMGREDDRHLELRRLVVRYSRRERSGRVPRGWTNEVTRHIARNLLLSERDAARAIRASYEARLYASFTRRIARLAAPELDPNPLLAVIRRRLRNANPFWGYPSEVFTSPWAAIQFHAVMMRACPSWLRQYDANTLQQRLQGLLQSLDLQGNDPFVPEIDEVRRHLVQRLSDEFDLMRVTEMGHIHLTEANDPFLESSRAIIADSSPLRRTDTPED